MAHDDDDWTRCCLIVQLGGSFGMVVSLCVWRITLSEPPHVGHLQTPRKTVIRIGIKSHKR
jgi:hypothetical protein